MALTKVQSALTNTGIVNMLDYGAVGDGSTNDSAAVLLTLNSGAKVVDGGGRPIS
jgi:polygalacturonase